MVAAVRVTQERLAAVGHPLDVAVELACGPGQAHVLRVQEDLGAEAAAHVRRDHAHLVLGQAQHEGRHEQPLHVRVLVADVQRVLVARSVVAADGRARLHGVGDEAVVDQVELGDVRGAGKRGIDSALVADGPLVAVVVGGDVVQGRAGHTASRGIGHADHGGQHVVVHLHQLGRVARLLLREGHDHGHMVAHVAHLALRQDGVLWLLHGLAIGAGDEPATGQAVDVVGRHIGAGEHAQHAGRGLGGVHLDAVDLGVGVRRAHEHRMALRGQHHVVGVLARAGEEAVVLLALKRFADVRQLGKIGCTHGPSPSSGYAEAMAFWPTCTARTMFW